MCRWEFLGGFELLVLLALMGLGWIIGHRPIIGHWHRFSTVVAFIGLRMLHDVPWWYPDIMTRVRQGHWLYQPHLQVPVVTLLLPLSILIGGLMTSQEPTRHSVTA